MWSLNYGCFLCRCWSVARHSKFGQSVVLQHNHRVGGLSAAASQTHVMSDRFRLMYCLPEYPQYLLSHTITGSDVSPTVHTWSPWLLKINETHMTYVSRMHRVFTVYYSILTINIGQYLHVTLVWDLFFLHIHRSHYFWEVRIRWCHRANCCWLLVLVF